jgi:hypothetical protein
MLYLLRIGKKTRKGGFNEQVIRAVSSDLSCRAVQNHFEKVYQGFEVQVSYLETITEEAPVEEKITSFIKDIPVRYTDEEKALHEKTVLLNRELWQLRRDLEHSIRERYRNLHYTDINNRHDIELETDDDGTMIRRLPLYGTAFFKEVEEANEI